jgi:hypothetical protein
MTQQFSTAEVAQKNFLRFRSKYQEHLKSFREKIEQFEASNVQT